MIPVDIQPWAVMRISVNHATLHIDGRWEDNWEWDEMQSIKKHVSHRDRWSFKAFPTDSDVVNVANMRHLFISKSPTEIGWRHD